MRLSLSRLEYKSKEIRRAILNMAYLAQASHVGTALSVADILAALYFNVANIKNTDPEYKNRDRIILSKGHGGVALIATLAHRGFFPVKKLKNYCKDGSTMTGHTMIESAPGIEVTTGSLGHGLAMGVGMALAFKRDHSQTKVYVILSDGELDEGSCWEAIMAAGHFKLDNLIAIVDYNKIQSFGRVADIMDLEPILDKWLAFNWRGIEINGHDFKQLVQNLNKCPIKKGNPSVIIAHTVKGKGVSFMEDKLEWHYKSPTKEELELALGELA